MKKLQAFGQGAVNIARKTSGYIYLSAGLVLCKLHFDQRYSANADLPEDMRGSYAIDETFNDYGQKTAVVFMTAAISMALVKTYQLFSHGKRQMMPFDQGIGVGERESNAVEVLDLIFKGKPQRYIEQAGLIRRDSVHGYDLGQRGEFDHWTTSSIPRGISLLNVIVWASFAAWVYSSLDEKSVLASFEDFLVDHGVLFVVTTCCVFGLVNASKELLKIKKEKSKTFDLALASEEELLRHLVEKKYHYIPNDHHCKLQNSFNSMECLKHIIFLMANGVLAAGSIKVMIEKGEDLATLNDSLFLLATSGAVQVAHLGWDVVRRIILFCAPGRQDMMLPLEQANARTQHSLPRGQKIPFSMHTFARTVLDAVDLGVAGFVLHHFYQLTDKQWFGSIMITFLKDPILVYAVVGVLGARIVKEGVFAIGHACGSEKLIDHHPEHRLLKHLQPDVNALLQLQQLQLDEELIINSEVLEDNNEQQINQGSGCKGALKKIGKTLCCCGCFKGCCEKSESQEEASLEMMEQNTNALLQLGLNNSGGEES